MSSRIKGENMKLDEFMNSYGISLSALTRSIGISPYNLASY